MLDTSSIKYFCYSIIVDIIVEPIISYIVDLFCDRIRSTIDSRAPDDTNRNRNLVGPGTYQCTRFRLPSICCIYVSE